MATPYKTFSVAMVKNPKWDTPAVKHGIKINLETIQWLALDMSRAPSRLLF